jgi:XTP/dITP diphosphohydrolase
LRRSLLIGLSLRKAGKLEKKMDLLLATGNQYKAREFRELLGHDFRLHDLRAFPEITMAAETGSTFAENAILKAATISKQQPMFVIADDSGLEVDALDGAPGIFSARYSGQHGNDERNIEKLLGELKRRNVPPNHCSAQFRCVIALARDGKLLGTFEGTVAGVIVDPPRGRGGFGYDPIFQPTGFDLTFAEMNAGSKNKISHRGKAIAALREALITGKFGEPAS